MSSGDGIVAVYPNDPSLILSGSAWATVSESNTTLAFAEGAAKGSLKFTGTTFKVHPIKILTQQPTGTQVAVVGVIETGLPVTSTYSIDGESSLFYTSPYDLSSADAGIEFFISEELTATEHQLVFEVLNATSDYPFILQYILYASSSSSSSSIQPSSSTWSGAAPTDTRGAEASVATHHSTSVGAIVGGVVGGVVGLAILAILVFFFAIGRRKKGRPYFYAEVQPAEMLSDGMSPLTVRVLKCSIDTNARRSQAIRHGHEPCHTLPDWYIRWPLRLGDGLFSSSFSTDHRQLWARLFPNSNHTHVRSHHLR